MAADMENILPPDYSILASVDVLSEYSDEELGLFYTVIHNLHIKSNVAAIKKDRYNSLYGNLFGYSDLIFDDDQIPALLDSIENDVIDTDHCVAVVEYFTGKITKLELNKAIFRSWFRQMIRDYRAKLPKKEEGEHEQ